MIRETCWPELDPIPREYRRLGVRGDASLPTTTIEIAVDTSLGSLDDGGLALTYLRQLTNFSSKVRVWHHTDRDPKPGEYHLDTTKQFPGVISVDADGPRRISLTAARPSPGTDSWLQSMGVPEEDFTTYYLAVAAQDVGAVLFVTTRDGLLQSNRVKRRARLVTPEEALSVIGLHMRISGEVLFAATPSFRDTAHASWAPLILTKRLLPDAWRIMRQQTAWTPLLGSSLNRLESILQLRDDILAESAPYVGRGRLRTVEAFEFMALMCDGGLDSLARSVNIALGLGLKPQDCGWRKAKFRNALQKAAPTVSAALDDPLVKYTIDLLAALRNTVHSEPYGVASVQNGHSPTQTPALVLPDESFDQFEPIAVALDRSNQWRHLVADICLLNPVALANDLIQMLIYTYRNVIESMPWPGVDLADQPDEAAQTGRPPDIFSDFYQERAALLYGLG